MRFRTSVRLVIVCALMACVCAVPFDGASGQGRRKEVEPKKAVRDADPSFAPVVEPGTQFTYRVSLKKGRKFVVENGDGLEVRRSEGNIAVTGMRRVSATIYEIDFSSEDTGESGAAALRINFTNQSGRLKFVRAAVAVALPGGDELVRINSNDDFVVNRLPVGSQPTGVATAGTPTINFLYAFVCNSGSNTVSVVDLRDDSLVTTIPVGLRPSYVAIAGQFGAQFAYVTNSGSDDVSLVDTQNFSVVGRIGVGDNPQGIAVAGQVGLNQVAYVANRDSNSVTVIDTQTNTVLETLALAGGPTGVAVAGRLGAQVVAVTLANANAVALIDANSNAVLRTVPVGARPVFVAVGGAQASEIFVVNQDAGSVSYIDILAQVELERISVGIQPSAVTLVGPTNAQQAYVTNRGDGTVSVVSVPLRRTVFTIPVGGRPRGAVTIGVIGSQEVLVTN